MPSINLRDAGWFARNWLWAVPLGCLSPILICGGIVAFIIFGAYSALRLSEPYTTSVAAAQSNPEVRDKLGEPITTGYFFTGTVQVTTNSGSAHLQIPLSGPKSSATLYVDAIKTDGKWEYSTLEVVPAGSEKRIDLRPPAKK